MATIILTAVGGAVGGPIGAAIGALAGQAIDARLFAPRARQGPRLSDLAVQTSSYGTPIPKLFGTMRVAGTVIWATDLRETRSNSGGGKGRPRTVSYSYSASLAVALSAQPIRAVRRIWADGKLLRGSAGDFKSETEFRFYTGDEDQAADPLISAAEGANGTPAYRGLAYAVFENLQLADFGNRIPSLSFEVEADAGPVQIGAVAAALGGGVMRRGGGPTVAGYLASGESIRGAIEELAAFVPLSLVDDGQALRIELPSVSSAVLDPRSAGARPASERRAGDEQGRRAAAGIAGSVTLGYADPERDYQSGLQRAFGGGPPSVAEQRVLPIAVSAVEAKRLAEDRLAALWAGRASASVHLDSRHLMLRPGMVVGIEGRAGLWRIERWTFQQMMVRLELVRVPGGAPSSAPATAGRSVAQSDLRHGATTLHLIELPSMGGVLADQPRLFAAAAGAERGWRQAALIGSFDGGASWQELGETAGRATLGRAETTLPPGGSALFDQAGSLIVALLNEEMELVSRTNADLVNGANLALLGDELVQFGRAEPLGSGRYRLTGFLRGRLGTEWAAVGHQAGEAFLLIEPISLAPIDAPLSAIGTQIRVTAAGRGDGADGVTADHPLRGDSVRPPAPVHLRAQRKGADVEIAWTRRSRAGWQWLDGTDVALGEESERYQLTISGTGFGRELVTSLSSFRYSAADQQADGAAGPTKLTVVQIGTSARSRPATITLDL